MTVPSARFGFKNVVMIPFSDENFTLNEAGAVTIIPAQLLASTTIDVELTTKVKKFVFADGSILAITDVNDTPGTIKLTVGKTENQDALKALLFPESYKITNGSVSAQAYTAPIGADRTAWQKALHIRIVDPISPNDKSKWEQGRAMVNTTLSAKFGVDLTQYAIVFDLIGGQSLSNNMTEIWSQGDPNAGTTVS
jgi:hypothetical protein